MARHSQNGSDDSHDDSHDISGCNFISCFCRWISIAGTMTAQCLKSIRGGHWQQSFTNPYIPYFNLWHWPLSGNFAQYLFLIFQHRACRSDDQKTTIFAKTEPYDICMLECFFFKAGPCRALIAFRFSFRVKLSRHWFQEQNPRFRVNFTNFESFARLDHV